MTQSDTRMVISIAKAGLKVWSSLFLKDPGSMPNEHLTGEQSKSALKLFS